MRTIKINHKFVLPILEISKNFLYAEYLPLNKLEFLFLILIWTKKNEKMGNILDLIKESYNLNEKYDSLIIEILNRLQNSKVIFIEQEIIDADTKIGEISFNKKLEHNLKNNLFYKFDLKTQKEEYKILFDIFNSDFLSIDYLEKTKNWDDKSIFDSNIINKYWINDNNWKIKINDEIDNKIDLDIKFNNDKKGVVDKENKWNSQIILRKNNHNSLIDITENSDIELTLNTSDDQINKVINFHFIEIDKNEYLIMLAKQIFKTIDVDSIHFDNEVNVLDFYENENWDDYLEKFNKFNNDYQSSDLLPNITIKDNNLKVIGIKKMKLNISSHKIDYDFYGLRDLNNKEKEKVFNYFISNNQINSFKTEIYNFLITNRSQVNQNLEKSIDQIYLLDRKKAEEDLLSIIDFNGFVNLINSDPKILEKTIQQKFFEFFILKNIENIDLLKQFDFVKIEEMASDFSKDIFKKIFDRKNKKLNEIQFLDKTLFYRELNEILINSENIILKWNENSSKLSNLDLIKFESLIQTAQNIIESNNNRFNLFELKEITENMLSKYREKLSNEILILANRFRKHFDQLNNKYESKISFTKNLEKYRKEIEKEYEIEKLNINILVDWWKFLSEPHHYNNKDINSMKQSYKTLIDIIDKTKNFIDDHEEIIKHFNRHIKK
ncbi:hypothetical protein ACUZ9N_01720 [Mycoplasmopsis gallinarum]